MVKAVRRSEISRRFIFPAFSAVVLYTLAMFFIFLPRYRMDLMEQKKNMTRELVYTAWGLLNNFEARAARGEIPQRKAQELALEIMGNLRYGKDLKDYFWKCSSPRPVQGVVSPP